MADECVVCGEAEEGKPLYKKLGSGEFNVEVITALKALQVVNIPEASKNSSYICWDCDGLIVEQYDRYLKEQQAAAEVVKQTKKEQQQRRKRKRKPKTSNLKLKISKHTNRDRSWGITKPQGQSTKNSGSVGGSLSKTKQLEQKRANNAYHHSHCLMCDNKFETERRTYQRFSLKNRVNDEMDIAQVMEVLGLARHIAHDMKARRFVCNPCFVIIRRNYKDKLMKETSEEAISPPLTSTPTSLVPQKSIHRATTEEHAAEIARLLPPGLAECYKIVTDNHVNKNAEAIDTSLQNFTDENSCQADEEEQDSDEEGEEEGTLKVSQDEHGNFLIDIHDKGSVGDNRMVAEQEEQPAILQSTRRKKNVLLPRRMHKHLSLSPQDTPERQSDVSAEENGNEKEEEENEKASSLSSASAQELQTSRKCNVCAITIGGKPSSWWHTLTSPIDGFDGICVTTALKLLETSLTSISQQVEEDQPVCLPCYNKVASGFKSQVVQKIARHRNIDVSEVNLSRVKVRTLPKEALEPPEVQERDSEAAESAESLVERSEEVCEGEKENMDIEKHGQKRKLTETNVLTDKKRKSYKGGSDVKVAVTPDKREEGASQNCNSGNKVKGKPSTREKYYSRRGKNGKFVKKNATISPMEQPSVAEASHQTESPDTGTQENSHTPQDSPETSRKQSNDGKESEPLVVLKDLRFVLPQEAFSGKTVSSHKIERIMEPPSQLPSDQPGASHIDLGNTSSPLQLVFSALSTYPPPSSDPRKTTPTLNDSVLPPGAKVYGRCVVCGSSYLVPLSNWHCVEEDIRPPTLLVPLRWVCISLAINLPQVSVEDARYARVCKECFDRLGNNFEEFVKRKVGESCGLEAEAVDLSEYIFTFNTQTMNLEADPKQQSYIHEFEDAGQLLQRIESLMELFSMDEMVSEGKRQPVLQQHYCVWLLLVLNDLRMQVGAAIGDLARWLVTLMPANMYENGLRPCPNNLASFLLRTTKCSKELTENVLGGPIPSWVFVSGDAIQTTLTEKENTPQIDEKEDDLCWEDFLRYVNLDALIGGKATPVSAVHFTQGLVYAIWRTSQLLGEGEQQVMGWLKQLAPLPLTKDQLENLVAVTGQLHNHLDDHPDDRHLLESAIIPQVQNDSGTLMSVPHSEKVITPCQAHNSSASEEDSFESKEHKSTPLHKSAESKKGNNNVQCTKKTPTMKKRKGSPQLKTPHLNKAKKQRSLRSNMNAGQNSDHGQGGAVSDPQTTPLVSHEKNHLRDSDALLAHTNANKNPTTSAVQDASTVHKSVDSAAICEPDQRDFAQSRNSHKMEQCSDNNTLLTSAQQFKELGAATQLGEKITVTAGSSKMTADSSQIDTQTVAISEHLKDTIATSVPNQDRISTAEDAEVARTVTKTLKDTITSVKSGEATAPIKGTSLETVVIDETSKQDATISQHSEKVKTPESFGKSSTRLKSPKNTSTVGVLEETKTSIISAGKTLTDIPKEIALTNESSEQTEETNLALKVTTETSETSKETREICGTSGESFGNPEEALEVNKTSEVSANTNKTSKDTGDASVTSEKTKEIADTSGISKEATEISDSSEETVETCGTSTETAKPSGTSEETEDTLETSKEITETTVKGALESSGASEETRKTHTVSEETGDITETSKENVDISGISEEIIESNGDSEETLEASEASQKNTETSEAFKKTSKTNGACKNTSETSESSENTTETSRNSEDISVADGASKMTTENNKKLDETSENIETSKKTAVANVTVKTSKSTKETSKVSETVEEIVETNGTAVKAAETYEILEEPLECSSSADKSHKSIIVNTRQPVEEITFTMKHTKETTPTNVSSGKTTTTIMNSNKQTAEMSEPQVTHNTTSHVKILESSHTLVLPSDNCSSENTKQHSMTKVPQNEVLPKKICSEVHLENGSQTTPKKTDEKSLNPTSSQQIVLDKDPGIQTDLEQRKKHDQKGSDSSADLKRTVCSSLKHEKLSNTPTKVCIAPSPQEEDNTSHQREESVHQSEVITQKTDIPCRSTSPVLRSKRSRNIDIEQRKKHDQKGSDSSADLKRTVCSSLKDEKLSNTPTKVCILTSPQEEDNTSHQREESVHQSEVVTQKTDIPCRSTSPVLRSKRSRNIDRNKLSAQTPSVVQNTKPSLHRSERVCTKVSSGGEKNITSEGSNTKDSVGSKKGNKRQYQEPHKESVRGEKRVDIKSSSSPTFVRTLKEGREGNNNTEISSVRLPKASSKGEVLLASVGHSKDKLKHTSKSKKYQFEDTDTYSVNKKDEKVSISDNIKDSNSSDERIPGNGERVHISSVTTVKNTHVEDHCDKGKEVEVSENSVHEKNKSGSKYHKPVTSKTLKIVVYDKKCHEKTPDKPLVLEENKQSVKVKVSTTLSKSDRTGNKRSPVVTPTKQEVACRTPKGPPEKKQKFTFEQLMNYDAGGISHS